MKKIIISLAIIVSIATAVAGATRAYFTSSQTIDNMTMATGTLVLDDVSDSWMTHVTFNNLKPGDMVRKWVKVQNNGSLDIASLNVSAINIDDSNGLLGQIKVAVYGQVNGFDQGIYSPNWGTGQPVVDWLSTGVNILGTAVYRDATAAHILAPGNVNTVILDFKVPAELTDEWQGKSAEFDLFFEAEQSRTGNTYF
jgi:hypothetical protein